MFNEVVALKKNAIPYFMEENYSNEAKRGKPTPYSINEQNIEFNYQLFLQKYMEKDADGNWIRKKEMWDGDKDKGYTPKKSTS